MGIFGSKLYFRDNSIATELISTLVQTLLQAFRLNRPICLQSAVYPLTLEELKVDAANVEFGKEALEERAKHPQSWNSETPFLKTWALEALFAIDVNWIPDLPLSILRTLNREGELLPTSLEGAYSKTRVLFTLRQRSMPDNDDRDKPVFKKVFQHFRLIANIVRNERGIYLNNQGQIGPGRKYQQGRLANPWTLAPHVDFMVKSLIIDIVDPIMEKVGQDVGLCWEVLKKEGKNPGTRENEEHLFTPEIEAAAQRLKDKGVTCEDISLFSAALYIIDSFTSACIRKQDKTEMWAMNTFVRHDLIGIEADRLVDILPYDCKNGYALRKSDGGMIALHAKNRLIERAYATMVVVGRARIKLEGYVLDEQNGPLDAKGQMINSTRRFRLFTRISEEFFGLPRLNEGILRSIQITMVVARALANGIDLSIDENMKRVVRECRTTLQRAQKNYTALKPAFADRFDIHSLGIDGREGPKK
ncbi:unnamed protein product, partial [Ectocarpus sp. 8 AP-2014]